MRGAPVGRVARHKPTARQERQDVLPGLEDLALNDLATPHHVTHALLRHTWNTDDHELARARGARQIRRVALVVLALHARALRNQRRRNDPTRIAPFRDGPVQDISGTARLVARTELTVVRH